MAALEALVQVGFIEKLQVDVQRGSSKCVLALIKILRLNACCA